MNEILVFTVITCLAVLIQSFVGFAGGLTAIPLFALLLAPKQAIPTYNMVLLLINLALVLESRQHVQWGLVGKLLVGGLAGIPIGAYALKYLPVRLIIVTISVTTCTFAILLLLQIRIALKENTVTQICVGLASGVLGGSVSQSGPPVIAYGVARGWDKNTFRTTLLTYFTFLCAWAVFSYWRIGLISRGNVVTFLFAIIPALAVATLGILLKNKASERSFRRAILITVIVVSVLSVSRAVLAA